MLKFECFKESYIEECTTIALNEYYEECKEVVVLPRNDYRDLFYNLLSDMMKHELGTVALDNNEVVGFLTCYAPINNFFGTVKGAFSPIYAHGTIKKNRKQIYSKLYQEVAKKWIQQGILSHAIALYAHNKEAIESFFLNGFGMRCVDAITSVNNTRIVNDDTSNINIAEISLDTIGGLLPLKNDLVLHMKQSPTFCQLKAYNLKEFEELSIKRKSRFFVASHKNKIVGYIEIQSSGENFTCDDSGTMNICGAYVKPEYRGIGISKSLLAFVIDKLRKENYKCCGVDFESINPTANKFWLKYFTPYTYSLTRRIDERVLKI